MNGKFYTFRWLAAFAVMLVLALNAVGLLTIRGDLRELSSTKRQGTIWAANQLEFELLRFSKSLALFISNDPDVTAEDVRFRFDILWSRQSVASLNMEEAEQDGLSDEALGVQRFARLLRETEDAVMNLEDGDTEDAQALLNLFAAYSEPLHDYTIQVKDEQAALDLAAREEIWYLSQLTVAFGGALGVGSVFLAALFFADSRHQRRISAENLRLFEQSQAAYRAKVEFHSTVSHELRTPLTSIKGVLGFFCGGALGELSEKAKEMSNIAYANSNKLEALINDIMDSVKSERDEWSFNFLEIDLIPIVEESINSISEYRTNRTVRFINNFELWVLVFTDSTRIDQAISNLRSNAMKFSDEGTDVVVTVDKIGDVVRLSVCDHGMGIPEEFKPRVFEKFAQANSSDTRSAGGTGLGLSITKRIVEWHGGTISFKTAEGVGTTFVIELPLRRADGKGQAGHIAA